jgi:AraC-like DNA-binding protein/DNA-binding CsgD family transcriptional regulator
MSMPADFSPIRFSTDALPEQDRIPAWQDSFGPRLFGSDVEPAPDVPFRVNVTARLLPGLKLTSTESSPARHARSRLLAKGCDYFGLHLSSAGGTVCQRGREAACRPGDAVVLTAAEMAAVVSPSAMRFRHLWFPRAELAPLVADLDAAVLRRVTPDSDALQYLLGYVRLLEEQHALADSRVATMAAVHVRDLFALLLGATRDAAVLAEGRGLRGARLHAIKRYVNDNVSNCGLSASAVAASHRLTPRYVQRLFEEEGTTFTEYVLNQRLARAREMLADSTFADRTVSAIALESGFADVSYFNRIFRRRHGMRPLDVRARYVREGLSALDDKPIEPSRIALSPRQRECLLWASHGLSTKQIAERLTLSEPVVHEYLSAAKRKLGCATRAHAVARAIKLGLIRP